MTVLPNGIEIPDPIIFHVSRGVGQGTEYIFVTRAAENRFILSRVPAFPNPSERYTGSRHVYRWGEMLFRLESLGIVKQPSLCHKAHDLSLTTIRTKQEPVCGPNWHEVLHEDFSETSLISLSIHGASGEVTEHLYQIDFNSPGSPWTHASCNTFKTGYEAASHYLKTLIKRQKQLTELETAFNALDRIF